MSKYMWTLWIIPVGVWGLYGCWYCGYQSGYAEGHSTVQEMFRTSISRPTWMNQHLASTPDYDDSAENAVGGN